jgi:hypothetical protein
MAHSTVEKVLTKMCDFLVVGITKVVVDNVASRTRAHFLSTRTKGVIVPPSSLWSLTIGPSDTFCEVPREVVVTFADMGGEVEFSDEEYDGDFAFVVDMPGVWKYFHALP